MTAHHTEELLAQFHDNQSLWLARLATGDTYPSASHPRVMETSGALSVLPGRSGVTMLPMNASMQKLADGEQASLAWIRQVRARELLTWSMTRNDELDLTMLAQGYRVGFEPWWMTRDLSLPIPEAHHEVRLVDENDIQALGNSDVPYVISEQIPAMRSLINHPDYPEVFWLVVYDNRKIAGHAIVNLADDHAGLFNVGVSGRYRQRGIGTSLTLAAMQLAQNRGALTMNLNSTPMGKRMYERSGFRQFGTGQTWVRSGTTVHQDAPPGEQSIALAIGRGDIDNLADTFLRDRLTCGLSIQELAARFDQPEMLRHLIERGHTPDIISLWKLDLRDEAIDATQHEYAREMITGSARATPIHYAVEMGAGTLVLALIQAGADLAARDGEYNATPLDWAHATNKPTIARIIRQAGGK